MKTKYRKCLLMMLSLTTSALIMHAGTGQLRSTPVWGATAVQSL